MLKLIIIIFPRNVSFRGYYVFDSNAAAAAPSAAASSHHFVVSAITFEGFRLRSSNLTHALFIQISRTSSITDIVVQSKMQKFQKKKKLRIDLKWQELWSKVIFGHPKWPPAAILSKFFRKHVFPPSPLFPTFHYFFQLFATFPHFPHFSPPFPTFPNFSPLFPTFPHFSNFSPL